MAIKDYDITKYDRPSVATDVVLLTVRDKEAIGNKKPKKGLQVLLTKRKEEPYKDMWSLPGGFVKLDESVDESAIRSLKSKTGLTDIYLEQLYTFGAVNRDVRGRIISVSYMALVDEHKVNCIPKDDNSKWFWVDVQESLGGINILRLQMVDNESECISYILDNGASLQSNNLAFDHKDIIHYAINRIRNKIKYTDLAFSLLPELFTIKDVQLVYEAILGVEIQSFRRMLGTKVVETENVEEGKAHRPARLYRVNKEYKEW